MSRQLDLAKRALCFDNCRDSALCLSFQRLTHWRRRFSQGFGVIDRSTARNALRSAELTGCMTWFLARNARRIGLGVSARLIPRSIRLMGCNHENRQPR